MWTAVDSKPKTIKIIIALPNTCCLSSEMPSTLNSCTTAVDLRGCWKDCSVSQPPLFLRESGATTMGNASLISAFIPSQGPCHFAYCSWKFTTIFNTRHSCHIKSNDHFLQNSQVDLCVFRLFFLPLYQNLVFCCDP